MKKTIIKNLKKIGLQIAKILLGTLSSWVVPLSMFINTKLADLRKKIDDEIDEETA